MQVEQGDVHQRFRSWQIRIHSGMNATFSKIDTTKTAICIHFHTENHSCDAFERTVLAREARLSLYRGQGSGVLWTLAERSLKTQRSERVQARSLGRECSLAPLLN